MQQVLLVDDHPLVLQGLQVLLACHRDEFNLLGAAASAREARQLAELAEPDLAIVDLRLPDGSGLQLIRALKAIRPQVRCVVLTSSLEAVEVREALQIGVEGYQLKDVLPDELMTALRRVGDGRRAYDPKVMEALIRDEVGGSAPAAGLSEREYEVLRELAAGRSNRQIAASLHISENTVKKHISSLLAKLQLQGRTQAALFAHQHHLAAQTAGGGG